MTRLCLLQPYDSALNLCPERKVKTQQVYLPTARPPPLPGTQGKAGNPCRGEASHAPKRTLLIACSGRPGPPVFHLQVLSAATGPASWPAAADPALPETQQTPWEASAHTRHCHAVSGADVQAAPMGGGPPESAVLVWEPGPRRSPAVVDAAKSLARCCDFSGRSLSTRVIPPHTTC